MRMSTNLLLLPFLFSMVVCCHNDDNSVNCVKEENYFTAEFDGQTLEPIWGNWGFGSKGYELSVYKPEDQNYWYLTVGTQNDIITMNILNIDGLGDYPIETSTIDDLPIPNRFLKTHIYILKIELWTTQILILFILIFL